MRVLFILTLLFYSVYSAPISMDETINIAKKNKPKDNTSNVALMKNISDASKITEIDTIIERTVNGIVSSRIINYKGGGYIVMSADNGAYPILVRSNSGYFDPNQIDSMHPIHSILEMYDKQISSLWVDSLKNSIDVVSANNKWNILNGISFPTYTDDINIDEEEELPDEYLIEDIQQIDYAQRAPYNEFTPEIINSSTGNFEHTLVDCVAIATGIVLKYYEFDGRGDGDMEGKFYDYYIMPNFATSINDNGVNDLANLLADIGETVNMNYGLSNSGTATSYVGKALHNNFRLSNSNYTSLSSFQVKNDDWEDKLARLLFNDIPFIVRGDHHAFVMYGYRNLSTGIEFAFNFGWANNTGNQQFQLNPTTGLPILDPQGNQIPLEGQVAFYGTFFALTAIEPLNTTFNFTNGFSFFYFPSYPNLEENLVLKNSGGSRIYNAKNTIETNGINPFIVGNQENERVRMIAGQEIRLKPGFKVISGGDFRAKINYRKYME